MSTCSIDFLRHRSAMPECRRAMSLVELLVVISIIAILSAMLLSAIPIVRDAARSSVCSSNLRQLGIAHLLYANDQEGWIPPPMGYGRYWLHYLMPYIGTGVTEDEVVVNGVQQLIIGLVTCPSHRIPSAYLNRNDWRTPSRSYGANNAYDTTSMYLTHEGYPLARIPGPSRTIILAEKTGEQQITVWGVVRPPYTHAAIDANSLQPTGMQGIQYWFGYGPYNVRCSHRSRFGIVCFDGHVEMAIPADTSPVPCLAGNTALAVPDRWRGLY